MHKPIHHRMTSEQLHRRTVAQFVTKVNTTLHYQKTEEEREKLKKTKAKHKRILQKFYGPDYNKKILNLPELRYEITMNM